MRREREKKANITKERKPERKRKQNIMKERKKKNQNSRKKRQ